MNKTHSDFCDKTGLFSGIVAPAKVFSDWTKFERRMHSNWSNTISRTNENHSSKVVLHESFSL